MEKKARAAKKRQEREAMRKYYEDEAELGSDNEGNDDIRKKINRNDADEVDGEDLDSDLEGFVVKGEEGDSAEIGAATAEMHEMYIK